MRSYARRRCLQEGVRVRQKPYLGFTTPGTEDVNRSPSSSGPQVQFYSKSIAFGFFGSGRARPAWHVRLILRAGDVHPNPGPPGTKWPCPMCGTSAKHGSVQCASNTCRAWVHTNCANIDLSTIGKFTRNGVERPDWKCTRCSQVNPTTLRKEDTHLAYGPRRPAPSRKQKLAYRWRNFDTNAEPQHRKNRRRKRDFGFVILQWNLAGIRKKRVYLDKLIEDHCPMIVCLQETNLTADAKFNPPNGYNCISRARTVTRNATTADTGLSHGGVMMLIHSSLNYSEIKSGIVADEDETTEWCAATVQIPGRRPMRVVNLYLPPIKNTDDDERVDKFDPNKITVTKTTIIVGDVNSHAAEWSPDQDEDNRGRLIRDWADGKNLIIANSGESTKAASKSAPDMTIHHASEAGNIEWGVLEDHGSDHLPIKTTILSKKPQQRRMEAKFSYGKARWPEYKQSIASQLATEPLPKNSAFAAWRRLRDVAAKAADDCIPLGCRKMPKAWWNERAEELVQERNAKRRDAQNGDAATKAAYNEFSRKVNEEISRMKAEAWRDYATNKINPRTSSSQVFRMIRKMDGRSSGEHPGTPLHYGNQLLKTDEAKAKGFRTTYASVSKLGISREDEQRMRPVIKEVMSQCTECQDPTSSSPCCPFTMCELQMVLNQLKQGKAPGSDNISNEMLVHLGEVGMMALLDVCNLSWEKKEVPADWRRATIIPILKNGKPPERTGSYRPISLTSCAAKVMERLVQQRLMYVLESSSQLNTNQAGFRKLRSTEDQCLRISQEVADGFNATPMKRTVMVLVDFARAFDTVWKKGLYQKLLELKIPVCTIQWTRSFLSDRLGRVSYGVSKSSYTKFYDGLPQGAVLSPLLFLCFINDIDSEMPKSVRVSLFADDLAMWSQSEDFDEAECELQKALDALARWSEKWKLQVNAEKTETTYFSNSTKDSRHIPDLQFKGVELKYNPNPRFLGITYDRQLTFSEHIKQIKKKMNGRNKVLQALRGRNWGCDEENMRLLYLVYVRTAAEYCAAAWAPSAANTQLQQIETSQNKALRVITGCTQTTPVDALQIESKVPPFACRAEELAATAYEKSLRLPVDNPRRDLAEKEVRRRLKRGMWRETALRFVEKTGLNSTSREELIPVSATPPWMMKTRATYSDNLQRPIRRTDPNDEKKEKAEETIRALSTGASYDIFTDGSAEEGTKNGGGGALIMDNITGKEFELRAPAGALTCSYVAELTAISLALQKIRLLQIEGAVPLNSRINLFTDSKSAVQKLCKRTGNEATIHLILTLLEDIAQYGCPDIHFQWIPSHCGIAGNERVDEIAKSATELPQVAAPISFSTAKACIQRQSKAQWLATSKAPNAGMKTRKDLEEGLTREERTLLSRMRTGGHTPLLAWYRHFITRSTGVPEDPRCPRCGDQEESLQHVMEDCAALTPHRIKLFAGGPVSPALHENPKAAVEFLRCAGLLPARI